MEKEALFAAKLAELKEFAKKQDNLLTKEQVEGAFADFDLTEDKLSMVHAYLQRYGIGVGAPFDIEANLSVAEKDYLKLYLEEIAVFAEVDDTERAVVFQAAVSGEASAQERLITLMLPKVADMARLYAGQGVLLEDLIGEGNAAVTAGVKVLKPAQDTDGAEASLAKQIMEAMESLVAENAAESKKEGRIAKRVNKVADAARELAKDYGRKVTIEELAAEGRFSAKAIEEAVRISGGKIEDLT